MNMQRCIVAFVLFLGISFSEFLVVNAFGTPSSIKSRFLSSPWLSSASRNSIILQMSDNAGGGGGTERERSTKKGISTIVKERVETKQKEDIKEEEIWRVLLHNDEVHTFQYVTQSLVKVIGTLDKKTAFEICVQTHNSGKATVTKTWKKQAEKYCLGMQRQGLTASIAPDKSFKGGGKGDDIEGGKQ
jgi:ATP-dependent Clp protease adapter protein ClpS